MMENSQGPLPAENTPRDQLLHKSCFSVPNISLINSPSSSLFSGNIFELNFFYGSVFFLRSWVRFSGQPLVDECHLWLALKKH